MLRQDKLGGRVGSGHKNAVLRDNTLVALPWPQYELLSKLLVSPLITPIVVPYITLCIFPFKEFRQWLI